MSPRALSLPLCTLWLMGCALGGAPQARDAGPPGRDAGPPPGGPDAGPPLILDGGLDGGPPGPTDAGPPPDAGPTCDPESCNGADDDCDGTIDEAAGCPCIHRVRGDHAYLFCDGAIPWQSARSTCEASGYSLAVIEDAAEDAFVFGEMSSLGLENTWLGLNDRMSEGQWVWLDGLPLAYEHWDSGEPNDGGGGEDCAIIMMDSGRESEWDDRSCGSDRDYVCEAPAP